MICRVNDFEIGVPQEITENYFFEETLNVMIETSRYMSLAVMDTTNTEFESVRKDCKNLDPYCAQRAAKGGCDPNSDDYEWIVLKCAPTCHTCELLDFSIRCPIPENAKEALSRNGGEFGLNAMFERIVGERELTNEQSMEGMEDLNYTAIIYSRPSTNISGEVMDLSSENIIDGPWVISLDDFLTDKECDRLIELGIEQGYGQSTEQSTNRDGSISEKTASKRRTSTNTFCGTCDDDPIAKFVLNKIATITGFPLEFSEELQLLQYHPGQYYKRHNDYIPSHTHGPSGPRVMTVLLYLNDVEEGGGTRFNELSETARPVDVKPKKGSAVLWPSVLDKDVLTRDIRTDHEALVVEKGMKYAANAWLHLRDEKNAEGIACG
jgi:prolyl 4-hydroxylase